MEPNLLTDSNDFIMINWFDRNFWGAEISAATSWASFQYLEGAAQLITAIAAAIAAIIFVVKGYYDMRSSRINYKEKKNSITKN